MDRAASALTGEVRHLAEIRKRNKKSVAPSESFEDKTKRLVTNDPKQWLKFREVMREKGVVTNAALVESFYFYLQYRDAEDSIDDCIDKWKKTDADLNRSLSKIGLMRSSMPVMA